MLEQRLTDCGLGLPAGVDCGKETGQARHHRASLGSIRGYPYDLADGVRLMRHLLHSTSLSSSRASV